MEALDRQSGAESYGQLYQYVIGRITAGDLKPLKASGTNGKKPALYREYWDILPQEQPDYSVYTDELKYRMSTRISIDYYMRHLDQYAADRSRVLQLNDYFLEQERRGGAEPEPEISMNERSFQIWGREKFLRQEQGCRILKRCGVECEALHFYDTMEPLAYYSRSRQTPQNILILENKDTFYSMRRFLMEGKERLLGERFETLIYGAGKSILRSFQDFSFSAEPYMQEPENGFYYFGDLDYEGIGIYERLAALSVPDPVPAGQETDAGINAEPPDGWRRIIKPFAAAYEKMLEKAGQSGFDSLPQTKERQNRSLSGRFYTYFTPETQMKMKTLLENGRYIPQEIINIGDLQQIEES